MSWVKEVKKLDGFNYQEQDRELFVPSVGYPHVHVGNDFIRYRHAHDGGGPYLADGEYLLPAINDVIDEAEGDILAVLRALRDNFEIRK